MRIVPRTAAISPVAAMDAPMAAEAKPMARVTAGPGAHPLDVMPNAGTVRVLYSGIMALVPLEKEGKQMLLFPDASRARISVTDKSFVIPAHRPWLLAKTEDLDEDSRHADFRVENDFYSVFILDRELLEFTTESSLAGATPTFKPDPNAVDFNTVCGRSGISAKSVALRPGPKIAAQVKLPALEVKAAAMTPLAFSFQPQCDLLTTVQPNRPVTHISQMDIPTGDQPFEFQSRTFDGSPALPPIRFLPATEGGMLLMLGHTPMPDIQAFIRTETPEIKLEPDVHFELYYDLVEQKPGEIRGAHAVTVPVPRASLVANPALPQVGNCPPIVGTVKGN